MNISGPKVTLSALSLIILIFIVTNLFWIIKDARPVDHHQANHLNNLLTLFNSYESIKTIGDLKNFFFVSHIYPPLFYLSTLPFVCLGGFSYGHALFANFLYIAILTLSVYGIGKFLFNRRVGIFSAALVFLYPIAFGLSREYLLDFALLAAVSLVQFLILKSEGGFKGKWNLFLAAAIGSAVLIKPNALIFIAPTFLFAFLANAGKRGNKITNPLVSLFISLAIILPWYLFSFYSLMQSHKFNFEFVKATQMQLAAEVGYYPLAFGNSFFHAYNSLRFEMLSPYLFQFFLIGVILFFIFSRKSYGFMFMLSWFLPAFLGFLFWPVKDQRYIVPILPFMAVMTIAGIDALPKKIARNFLFALIFFIGFMQFFSLSFGFGAYLFTGKYNHARVAAPDSWKIKEILGLISKAVPGKNVAIGIFPQSRYLNSRTFYFYANFQKLPYKIFPATYFENMDSFKELDIFIEIEYLGPPLPKLPTAVKQKYTECFEEFKKAGAGSLGFKKITYFELPGNRRAVIYKNMRRDASSHDVS